MAMPAKDSLKTPIRRLEGITYWVIEDPDAIYDFINKEVRKEWEADAKFEHRDPKQDPWLRTLSKRRWRLETIMIRQIKSNPDIMNYEDKNRGYDFSEEIIKRSDELRKEIEEYSLVIWPVIVRSEDFMLIDGYCRYSTLKAMNIQRVYAYVGEV